MPAAHAILGIAADADEATIKRAFRKLAMSLHPDRNPEAGAEEAFKAARAAYESMMAALQDGEAEAEFSEEEEPSSPAPAETAVPRGEDLHRDLELTLEEAAFGCQKTLVLACAIPCGTCEGTGEYGASRSSLCSACQGSGRIRQDGKLEPCPRCAGRGFLTSRTCPDCGGNGSHPADRHLQVHVPPGVLAGNELRLAGQGGAAPEGGQPGHLFLRIVLLPHPLFQPVERDLLCRMPLSILRWLAGGRIAMPQLDGSKHDLVLPPASTLTPEPQRLKGLGLPGRGRQPAGDLIVVWQPVIAALSPEQIALLDAAAKAGGA